MADVGRSRVVVGVDGSEPSLQALDWAARQADLMGATLDVVTAWTFPEEPTPFGIVPPIVSPIVSEADPLTEARNHLQGLVAEVRSRYPVMEIAVDVIRGRAEHVLLDAAQDADVLVVGSRGRGAFKEILLGSVSEHCARHAACPVVVVRPVDKRSK